MSLAPKREGRRARKCDEFVLISENIRDLDATNRREILKSLHGPCRCRLPRIDEQIWGEINIVYLFTKKAHPF